MCPTSASASAWPHASHLLLFLGRAKCVRFSPAGNSFAVASTEGLLVFTQDSALKFAPFELDESVTPDSIRAVQGRGEHAKAVVVSAEEPCSGGPNPLGLHCCPRVQLCAGGFGLAVAFNVPLCVARPRLPSSQMALHLNVRDVLLAVIEAVPTDSIPVAVAAVPFPFLQRWVLRGVLPPPLHRPCPMPTPHPWLCQW